MSLKRPPSTRRLATTGRPRDLHPSGSASTKCARAIKPGLGVLGTLARMTPTIHTQPTDLVVHGLALRTSPATAARDIPQHWQRFMAQPPIGEGPLYAVYCDYESDSRGAYTLVLGRAVAGDTKVPEGLRRVRVPAGACASFRAVGDPTQVIWKTWQHVNEGWPGRAQRRYIADFERYLSATEAEVVVGIEG